MAKPKHRRGKGSSKAGRPRNRDGDRYPSGGLRPVTNQFVADRRKAIADNPEMSTNPLDCALHHRWITEAQHRAGSRYAQIRHSVGFRDGNVTASAGQEVDLGGVASKLSFSEMSDEIIAAAWDRVAERTKTSTGDSDSAPLELWRRINTALTPAQEREVYLICAAQSWPFWITSRLAARDLEVSIDAATNAEHRGRTEEEMARLYRLKQGHQAKYRLFIDGLEAVRRALFPPAAGPRDPTPEPRAPTPRHQKRTDKTTYVDTDGEVMLQVVRRTRSEEQA